MKRARILVGLVGAAALLTACGGGDSDGDGGSKDSKDSADDFTSQSADEIVADSKAALKDLKSVRLTGTLTTDGQEMKLDLVSSTAGECDGSIGVGDATVEIRSLGGTTWFRPDEAFWRSQGGAQADQVIELVGDKWVLQPEGQSGFGEVCDLDSLLEEATEDDSKSDSTYEKGDVEEIDGEDAIAIKVTDSDDEVSTNWVRVEGEHYLVRLSREGEESGEVTFSEFNEKLDVEAPADDEVVDLNNLGG